MTTPETPNIPGLQAFEQNLELFQLDLIGEKSRSRRGAHTYARHVRLVFMFCATTYPDVAFSDLSTKQLRNYIRHLTSNGRSASYRRVAIFALRAFYDWLAQDDATQANPADKLAPPPQRKPRTNYYTPEQFGELLDVPLKAAKEALAAGNHRRWLRYRVDHALLATLRYTGIRRDELFNLRISDVDLTGRRLKVMVAKGDKPRSVPIAKPLGVILKGYLRDVRPLCPSSGWLFANPDGFQQPGKNGKPRALAGRYDPRALYDIVGRYATTADIPGPHHPHRIRHGVATEFIRNNKDLETLRMMLGHADLATTSRYLHLDDEHLTTAVDDIYDDHDNPDLGDDHTDTGDAAA